MNLKQTLIMELCIALAASVALGPPLHAQQTADAQSESPIPVITGDFNFQSTFQPGTKMLMPEFDPVLLLPNGHPATFTVAIPPRTVLTSALAGCKGFILNPTLTSIVVSPATPSITARNTQQMVATGTRPSIPQTKNLRELRREPLERHMISRCRRILFP